jgi:hypothetical protein
MDILTGFQLLTLAIIKRKLVRSKRLKSQGMNFMQPTKQDGISINKEKAMKHIKEYQEVMQNLYKAAGKYPDEKLAEAIGDVRDLIVEYRNIIDSYESSSMKKESGDN